MRRRTLVLTAAPLAGLAALAVNGLSRSGDEEPSSAAPAGERMITVTDDVGRRIAFPHPVTRSVVLNRYVLEQVRAIGAMSAVVGVDAGPARRRDYWPTLSPEMVVGQNQSNPNYEAVIAKHPEAVLLPRNAPWQEVARQLEPFGIQVVVVTAWDIEAHERNVELLGAIYGRATEADRFNSFFREHRQVLRDRLTDLPRRRRVYIEETRPNVTGIEGSGWHAMIEAGGGENLYGELRLMNQRPGTNPHHFEVDPEETLRRDPEAIIKLQPGQYAPHPRSFSEKELRQLISRPGFSETTAVRNGAVYHLSYYMASGSSKLTGALQIAKWLYPERFTDIEPEAVMQTWLEKFQRVPGRRGYSASLPEVLPEFRR